MKTVDPDMIEEPCQKKVKMAGPKKRNLVWTEDEDMLLLKLFQQYPKNWVKLSSYL